MIVGTNEIYIGQGRFVSDESDSKVRGWKTVNGEEGSAKIGQFRAHK